MHKIFLFVFCLWTVGSYARVVPAEGSKLNYVLAGFMADEKPGADHYMLQVAKGYYTDKDENAFEKHLIISKQLATNHSIEELPSFGTSYTWRFAYLSKKNKLISATPLYHFATDTSATVDTAKHRLKVITNKLSNSPMMITTDFTAVIYNLQGKPLWFLPKLTQLNPNPVQIRDFKPTDYGTFTMLYGFNAIEVDYNGHIVWQAPNDGKISGDSTEFYHHEFTRLHNGHYLVCGDEIWWAKPDSIHYGSKKMPTDIEEQAKKGQNYRRYVFGTLIEYDTAGNVVWHWRSKEHFLKEENIPFVSKPVYTGFTHLNSFYFNEADSAIYLSFRDINRVVKIKYPTGEWLNSYGDKYANDSIPTSCDYFCGQHCVRTNNKGELFLFDNHSKPGNPKLESFIRIFREPETTDKKANLTELWAVSCNIDSAADGGATTGGGVYELPDGAILCTVGAAGRLLIVDRNKHILWNAVSQQNTNGGAWHNTAEYRVYPIENKAVLEKFIFD